MLYSVWTNPSVCRWDLILFTLLRSRGGKSTQSPATYGLFPYDVTGAKVGVFGWSSQAVSQSPVLISKQMVVTHIVLWTEELWVPCLFALDTLVVYVVSIRYTYPPYYWLRRSKSLFTLDDTVSQTFAFSYGSISVLSVLPMHMKFSVYLSFPRNFTESIPLRSQCNILSINHDPR